MKTCKCGSTEKLWAGHCGVCWKAIRLEKRRKTGTYMSTLQKIPDDPLEILKIALAAPEGHPAAEPLNTINVVRFVLGKPLLDTLMGRPIKVVEREEPEETEDELAEIEALAAVMSRRGKSLRP